MSQECTVNTVQTNTSSVQESACSPEFSEGCVTTEESDKQSE